MIDMTTLSLIFDLLWRKSSIRLRFALVSACGFLCLAKISSSLVPFIYKFLFDAIEKFDSVQNFSIGSVILVVFAYAGVRFLSQILNELKEICFVSVEQNAAKTLALETFSHLQYMGMRFHLSRKMGEVSKVMERGVKAIETFLRFATFSIFPTFLETIFVCILVFLFYPYYYFVLLFLTLALYCVYTILITQWRTGCIKEMKLAETKAASKAVDSLINYETVKYFNNQSYEATCYSNFLKGYAELAVKNRRSLSVLNVGQALIIALGLVGINLAVILDILANTATIGDFALVNTYLLQLYIPLGNLGFAYREMRLAYLDVDSVRELLSKGCHDNVQNRSSEFVFKEGVVEFKDVSFGYSDDRQVLRNLSFRMERGKTLAIVGKSGAGKSTISKLLFGFYSPSKGQVLIDGQDLSTLRPETFQRYIGVVPQDITLFNDTIFNNIAYSDPQNTKLDDVIRVANLASVHEFITRTKEQYQTVVGERGLKLSGGEKQRVAIARMLLKKDAKILVFDEASSSLDSKTESAIKESIMNAGKDCTSLIIAHRLSTVVYADEILVLACGEVVERGTHSTLLAMKGAYYTLWQHQNRFG
ncbi:ABCB family ABC transporter ATP-binding protein/permease [Neorickettsia sp. 179522]|uniref:ABCB family ABC transporter ATP-binding protein/permease n=1 Tax=Neorickettsia sp. 179522 TaxID=1714371 RepID=UPI000A6A05B5|nr:ATP-binding cassette domain-containing protein [Neorickettsia sp. 179522]